MGQKACSILCAISVAKTAAEAKQKKDKAEEAKKDREAREKLKGRSYWLKAAQAEFNRYIRLRDFGKECISCNTILGASEKHGGQYDAGHFRSVGSAPHMRFVELNVHGQCKKCNRWGAGMHSDYRAKLIKRIGLAGVEKIEADQEPRKYTIDQLKELRQEYRLKAKKEESAKEKGA